jgi:hypothetical protein
LCRLDARCLGILIATKVTVPRIARAGCRSDMFGAKVPLKFTK